jgi:hypothetical protein
MSNKTYAELSQNLQDWVEDDDAEFVGSIDEVINLGEMRLWRDLDLSIFTTTSTATISSTVDTITKPVSDPELVAWDQLYYDSGNKRVWLELRSSDYVRDMQTPNTLGSPRYYAEETETTWTIAPISDAAYTINVRGTTRPTRLSAGNTTTWLSLHQDDLLLKACLAEAEKFLKSDDRAPIWTEDYVGALPLAKRETYTMLASRYNLTPLQIPGVATTQR